MQMMLSYFQQTLIAIPNLLSELNTFHKLSGLGINISKCSALPINCSPNMISLLQKKNVTFIWCSHSFRYLGIHITSFHKLLYKTNYPPLFTRISSLLKIWSSYHISISFLGRICTIKMTILPKLLYYFRALPINIPKTRVEAFQREINRFIWSDKKPTYNYSLMHRPQNKCGLGLPNIWHYFLAARLTQSAQWFAPTLYISWITFESTSISPLYLQGILQSNLKSHHDILKLNTIVAHSLQLWLRISDNFKLSLETPPLATFLGDSRFTQAHNDNRLFSLWLNNNLTTLRSLVINIKFPSFSSLQSKYKCPSSEFPCYLQIKNFYATLFILYPIPSHIIRTYRYKLLERQRINFSILWIPQ